MEKEERRVGFGIIGCGSIATHAVGPALGWSANAKLRAIASRDRARAEEKARLLGAERAYDRYEALLEDPAVEAIYLALPNGLHEEWALRAAAAGKHVLCEKSLALSEVAAERMVETFRKRGLLLVEAFSYRHHPQWHIVRRLLRERAAGDVRMIFAHLSGFTGAADHRWSRELGGGALYDVTCYGVDVARFLLEAEPLRAQATAVLAEENGVDASSQALLEFPGGVLASVSGSLRAFGDQSVTVLGNRGRLVVHRPFSTGWGEVELTVTREGGSEQLRLPGANHYLHAVEHFASLVLDRSRPSRPAEDGLANARVLAAIEESFRRGSAISIAGPNSSGVSPASPRPTVLALRDRAGAPISEEMARRLEEESHHLTTGLTPGFLNAPRIFRRGRGARLYDSDGREYFDFASGTFTNATGHCHPRVVEFMTERLGELWNIHDYSSEYRGATLEKLSRLTPPQIDTFELYSGGTETIEAGLRALYSYLPPERKRFCSFQEGFHGKTLGSRTLNAWQMPGEVMKPDYRLRFPNCYRCPFGRQPESCRRECLESATELLSTHDDIGALVLEPILGAAGVIAPPPGYLEAVQETCRKKDIRIFADEVCVGFGRTGRDFAFEHYALEPDLIAFAKGIGSGFPVMALGGRAEIMKKPPFGAPGGASTTFGGNPLAVAAVHVTMEVYEAERLAERSAELGGALESRLLAMKEKYPAIGDVRVRGLFGCLDLVKDRAGKEPDDALGIELHKLCMSLGLKTFAFGHIFRIAPPLVISASELHAGLDRLDTALERLLCSQ